VAVAAGVRFVPVAAEGEASYGVDWYKAHTSGQRHRALAAFGDRLRELGARAS